MSFLECVNVVKDTMDWKNIETLRSNATDKLKADHIKAFYTVTRNSSFSDGARSSMETSGLGKLRPNLVLIGFKENWDKSPSEAKEYFKVLQLAFEMHLSVSILRITGGFDLSSQGSPSVFSIDPFRRDIQLTLDEGLADSSLPPPPAYSPPISFRVQQDLEQQGKSKLCCGGGGSRKEPTRKKDSFLVNSRGGEIHDLGVIKTMTQFRNEDEFDGYLDVYWLYDDGGLSLLIPYILTTRKKYSKCKLRVFVLASKTEELDEETRNMAALLSKFRIDFHDIITLSEITRYPGKKIRDEFKQMIAPFVQSNGPNQEQKTTDGVALMTPSEVANNSEKTNFHLRIAELVRENSKHASIIIMTLPIPTKDESLPFALYLSWLDITTKQMPPFLLVRGNQESVLTFYS